MSEVASTGWLCWHPLHATLGQSASLGVTSTTSSCFTIAVPTATSHPDSWQRFRNSRAFLSLPDSALQEMFSETAERSYEPRDALFRQGDAGNGLFVLLEGTAYARIEDSGRGHVVGRFAEGDLVGEMSLVTHEPRTADVVAETHVRALWLSSAAFDRLAARHLELCGILTTLVAERLGQSPHDGLGGKRLEGFRILRCIGRGGMAIVYEAVNETSREQVALKMMSHRLIYDSEALSRFRQEAEHLRSLDHENIVRLKWLFPAFGTYFLVLEFCDGVNLKQWTRTEGPLPEASVRPILGQVAEALDYVHRRNLVHCDIKPSNVMISRSGAIKLMDFGLTVPLVRPDDETRLDDLSLMGTPAFMAPEQLGGESPDARADVYSLACLAYSLLAGKSLFRGTRFLELVREKSTVSLPPAAQIGYGISDELHELLDFALRANAAERLSEVSPFRAWKGPVDPPPPHVFDPEPRST